MLTAEQISQNWDSLMKVVTDNFTGDRHTKLVEMYEFFKDRMCLAPASGKTHYHNCFTGGYVHHVLNVLDLVKKHDELWTNLNPDFKDYTDEELIFSALVHDLGKIGGLEHDYYTPAEQNWKIERGELYEHNPELQFMKVADRTLFLLQHFEIKITEKEHLAIYLHDGMYDESNKSYLMTYGPGYQLKTNLPFILHAADMMASKAERNTWKLNAGALQAPPPKQLLKQRRPKNATKKKLSDIATNNEETVKNIGATFDELFGGLGE